MWFLSWISCNPIQLFLDEIPRNPLAARGGSSIHESVHFNAISITRSETCTYFQHSYFDFILVCTQFFRCQLFELSQKPYPAGCLSLKWITNCYYVQFVSQFDSVNLPKARAQIYHATWLAAQEHVIYRMLNWGFVAPTAALRFQFRLQNIYFLSLVPLFLFVAVSLPTLLPPTCAKWDIFNLKAGSCQPVLLGSSRLDEIALYPTLSLKD